MINQIKDITIEKSGILFVELKELRLQIELDSWYISVMDIDVKCVEGIVIALGFKPYVMNVTKQKVLQ